MEFKVHFQYKWMILVWILVLFFSTNLTTQSRSVRFSRFSDREWFVCPSDDRVMIQAGSSHVTCASLCRSNTTCKSVFFDVSVETCYGCNKVYPTSTGLVSGSGGSSLHYFDEGKAVGLSGRHVGVVLVFRERRWGTVCDDGWYDHLAGHKQANIDVLCGSLGFNSGSVLNPGTYNLAQASGVPIWMDGIRCSGTEQSLLDCPHNGLGIHDCGHDEDLIVSCYDK